MAQPSRRDKLEFQFFALPTVVARSPGYRAAGHAARSLLVDICLQLVSHKRKGNNGRLVASPRVLAPLGWNSRDTITRCLRELQHLGLLVETKKGGLNSPSWYAVTWLDLNVSAGLDINPRLFERGGYMRTPAAARPTIGTEGRPTCPMLGQGVASLVPTVGQVKGESETPPVPMVGHHLEKPSAAASGSALAAGSCVEGGSKSLQTQP